MNKHAELLTPESLRAELTSAMRRIATDPNRSPEQAVFALETYFEHHPQINGRFSTEMTIWGFPELTFEGTLAGERIGHTIWY